MKPVTLKKVQASFGLFFENSIVQEAVTMKAKCTLSICIIICFSLFCSGCIANMAGGSEPLSSDETAVVNGEIKSNQSNEVFAEPPVLSLTWSSGSADVSRGSYSWNYAVRNGMWAGTCADSMHPLQAKDYIQPLYLDGTYAKLSFESMPDKLSVSCWADSEWENLQAESEEVVFNGIDLELKNGGYIYWITAEWFNDGGDFYGTSEYYFYAVVE